jgi:hypothetical protein
MSPGCRFHVEDKPPAVSKAFSQYRTSTGDRVLADSMIARIARLVLAASVTDTWKGSPLKRQSTKERMLSKANPLG